MSGGKNLFDIAAATVSELLSAAGIPGTGAFAEIAKKHLEKRQLDLRNEFIDELSNGYHGKVDFSDQDQDPFIGMILRLMKAAGDGVARDNLRFLIQVMLGLKKNRSFEFDKFARWSGIIENMTRSELLAVGFAYLCMNDIKRGAPGTANTFWPDLQKRLVAAGFDADEVEPVCASVARTGLLVPVSAWSGMAYYPSRWLEELAGLADLEAMRAMKR